MVESWIWSTCDTICEHVHAAIFQGVFEPGLGMYWVVPILKCHETHLQHPALILDANLIDSDATETEIGVAICTC